MDQGMDQGMDGMRPELWVTIRGARAHCEIQFETHGQTHSEGTRQLDRPARQLVPMVSRGACAAARPIPVCGSLPLAPLPRVTARGGGAKGPDCYFSCR
jgi:hypothetical protein